MTDLRGSINRKSVCAKSIDKECDIDYVDVEEVMAVLDELEVDIASIIRSLSTIKGLTEVDDIRYEMEELASKIF